MTETTFIQFLSELYQNGWWLIFPLAILIFIFIDRWLLAEFHQNVWWFAFFIAIAFIVFIISRWFLFILPIIPIILVFILVDRWLASVRIQYNLIKTHWILLEVQVPPDITKTPKAMEQIFTDLHGIYSKGGWIDRYFKGRTVPFLIFEIIANNGALNFYVRTPALYRNMVEAKIYAQYPKAEIREVDVPKMREPSNWSSEAMEWVAEELRDDKTLLTALLRLPSVVPNKDYECRGTEFILEKDLYPIRTYHEFESTVEEQRLDPLSHLAELADKLGPEEYIGVQIFIEPAWGDFKKRVADIVNQILGRTMPKKRSFVDEVAEYSVNLAKGIFSPPEWAGKEEERPTIPFGKAMFLSPGERADLEALERKIEKLFFRTGIRCIYIAKRKVFQKRMENAIYGFFRLFNNPRTNSLVYNKEVKTSARWKIFEETRKLIRKRNLYFNFVKRNFPAKTSFLNAEELATLFHFPSMMVEAPGLRSVQAKKGSPPPELPIIY